jgi:regulator of replication initiation timing
MSEKRFTVFKSKLTGLFVVNDNIHEFQFEGVENASTIMKLVGLLNNYIEENEQLKQSNERLLKMLDNIANYMQKQNKYMPIDDFVEWWNGIATKGLDYGDV